MTRDELRALVRTVPDFPAKGIQFRDITTLLNHGSGLNATIGHLAEMARASGADAIAGMEARGFIFGAAVNNLSVISWPVLIIAFLAAASGFYYYFKVIRAIYWFSPSRETTINLTLISKVALIVLTAAIIIFGIFPQPIMAIIGA